MKLKEVAKDRREQSQLLLCVLQTSGPLCAFVLRQPGSHLKSVAACGNTDSTFHLCTGIGRGMRCFAETFSSHFRGLIRGSCADLCSQLVAIAGISETLVACVNPTGLIWEARLLIFDGVVWRACIFLGIRFQYVL